MKFVCYFLLLFGQSEKQFQYIPDIEIPIAATEEILADENGIFFVLNFLFLFTDVLNL